MADLSEALPVASASTSQADSESAESDSDGGVDDDLESEESRSSASVTSMLNQLRCPPASRLARKRKIKMNSPPIGEKRRRGHVAANPKSITASERVKSYPKECLTTRGKVLFCTACREEISLKKSVISMHIKSKKHECGKSRLEKQNRRELSITDALTHFDKEHHPSGETLPVSTCVY